MIDTKTMAVITTSGHLQLLSARRLMVSTEWLCMQCVTNLFRAVHDATELPSDELDSSGGSVTEREEGGMRLGG